MDFVSYASAGRLSELMDNAAFLSYDRNQRRLGILHAAEETLQFIKKDPETYKTLVSYTRGVNAFIKGLNYKTMPFEYKLLDYHPEPWSELKSVLILKALGNTLSGYEEDVFMSKMISALGEKRFNQLFPDFNSHITPVMDTLRGPKNILREVIKKPDYLDYGFMTAGNRISRSMYNPRLGSNSWAISGKKTKSGYPILANDPHLNLSLPSFWLEMQLSSPEQNVYGVSIPGTPAIIIGYNQNVAWGITNGADDVKDWYKESLTKDFKKYKFKNQWKDLSFRIEEIKRKNHLPLYDTVYTTAHGPVVSTKNFPGNTPELLNYSMKWELLNPSNEFKTFIYLNRAKNYKDYQNAIKNYSCPILNFTFASKDGTIAINHQGRMQKKISGQGRFLLDGNADSPEHPQYIPVDSLPQLLNPKSGFVLSANQHPTYFSYPYYYNGYFSETRANRIHTLLNKTNTFDIKSIQEVQLDNTNSFAQDALPVFIAKVDLSLLNKGQKALLFSLGENWKGAYGRHDVYAKIFDSWLKGIRDMTWSKLKKISSNAFVPADYALLDLVTNDPSNELFDQEGTTSKETAGNMITDAFILASRSYEKLSRSGSIEWQNFNRVNLMHMTNIPAFSVMNLPSAGNPDAINATSGNWGPSWRMIVQLGPQPKAYGIYPGGQSVIIKTLLRIGTTESTIPFIILCPQMKPGRLQFPHGRLVNN